MQNIASILIGAEQKQVWFEGEPCESQKYMFCFYCEIYSEPKICLKLVNNSKRHPSPNEAISVYSCN